MKLRTVESLSLHSHPSEIEKWVERFELWCSLRQNGRQDQSVLFLTVGGKEMYSLLKNFAFPDNPAKLPFPILKQLLLAHVMLVDFQATVRAKFNSVVRAESISRRYFILVLNKQASKCNYGDRLEQQLCDCLIAGINNINFQRKLLEKKDLTFSEAGRICEQHDDLTASTTRKSPTLFQSSSRGNKPGMQSKSPHNQTTRGPQPRISIGVCRAVNFICGPTVDSEMQSVIPVVKWAIFRRYAAKGNAI
ncbi:unnamed protein product [Echinostoma caproni]|uniref:Uncharacterized protein n=1 Tax=Echinostoma caproni TaxID=27848 RepID=A0A183BGY8_9TREM|nr:unnamed protein product [Echinostoma caproni]